MSLDEPAAMNDGRLFPARPLIGVSIAVIRDGRVLLAARANEPMRGVWTLPGGLVEAGERLAEAALRELGEEVGVGAQVIGPSLTPTEIILRDEGGRARHHYVIHPHAAAWRSGEPAPGPEALDVRWARPEEVAGLETTPGLAGTLAEAFSRLADREGARAPSPLCGGGWPSRQRGSGEGSAASGEVAPRAPS